MVFISEKLRQRLFDANPFWRGSFEFNYVERDVYSEIKRFVNEKQVVALCGLRRVGKTTMLYKLISDLLKENKPEKVLYFSFDDFVGEPRDVVDAFLEIHGFEPRFLFFDEIQKVGNWSEKIKLLYDSGKYKIFLSGSESLFLRKGTKESLGGRIFEIEVSILSFREYLRFVGKSHLALKPLLYENELRKAFADYVLIGGFPELIGKTDEVLIKTYLRELIDKIIFFDIPRIYPVDDLPKLKAFFEIVLENPGMQVDFASLAGLLSVSRQTLSKYAEYLLASHLFVKLYNFSKNRLTSEKKLKKFYPTVLSPALLFEKTESNYGKVIESLVVNLSRAKFFWRDQYKNEVDLIQTLQGTLMPIEVKYRENPVLSNIKGISLFAAKYNCKKALVITKNERGVKQLDFVETTFIPVWQYLLEK